MPLGTTSPVLSGHLLLKIFYSTPMGLESALTYFSRDCKAGLYHLPIYCSRLIGLEEHITALPGSKSKERYVDAKTGMVSGKARVVEVVLEASDCSSIQEALNNGKGLETHLATGKIDLFKKAQIDNRGLTFIYTQAASICTIDAVYFYNPTPSYSSIVGDHVFSRLFRSFLGTTAAEKLASSSWGLRPLH